MQELLGFVIFNTLYDFFQWQGDHNSPAVGTVNYFLGYSVSNPLKSVCYTRPIPHPNSSQVVYDQYLIPIEINGEDLRVLATITDLCPVNLLPSSLITLEQAELEGWIVSNDEL